MTDFEETSKKIQDLVDEVFKQGIGVGYDHGLEVGTQNGYKRGYKNGTDKKQELVDEAYGMGYRHGLEDRLKRLDGQEDCSTCKHGYGTIDICRECMVAVTRHANYEPREQIKERMND